MPQYGYSMFGPPAGDDYDSDDDYVTIDRPEDMSNEMLDAYIGEVSRADVVTGETVNTAM